MGPRTVPIPIGWIFETKSRLERRHASCVSHARHASFFGTVVPAAAQQDAANVGTKLLNDPAIKAAVEAIKTAEPQTIEDQVRLCEVEAPPFKETKRGEVYARMFREAAICAA